MKKAVNVLCFALCGVWVVLAGCADADRAQQLQAIEERLSRLENTLDQLDIIEKSITELENTSLNQQQTISALAAFDKTLEKRLDALRLPSAVKPPDSRSIPAPGAYTVKRGDTLYLIAKKHGMTVDELCRLNKITSAKVIRPGQQLLVAPAR